MCRLDNVHLHGKILIDELGRKGVVRVNSADPRRRQEYIFGFVLAKEGFDSSLIDKIKLGMAAREKISIPAGDKPSHQCRAYQTAVACNINLGRKVHEKKTPCALSLSLFMIIVCREPMPFNQF